MNEDPELRVLVPFGRLIFLKGFPVGTKWPLTVGGIDVFEQGGPRFVVPAAGCLPYLIDACGIVGHRGSGSTLRVEKRQRAQHRNERAEVMK